MIVEALSAGPWHRLADPGWDNPLDPTWAALHGGRWNPARVLADAVPRR